MGTLPQSRQRLRICLQNRISNFWQLSFSGPTVATSAEYSLLKYGQDSSSGGHFFRPNFLELFLSIANLT